MIRYCVLICVNTFYKQTFVKFVNIQKDLFRSGVIKNNIIPKDIIIVFKYIYVRGKNCVYTFV